MVHGSPAQPIEGADRSPNFKRFAPAGRVTLTHGASVFVDGLMWHRRSDSRLTVDGEAHGPAHGSPSAECARIVPEIGEIRAFLHEFGSATEQGEVMVHFGGVTYRITEFDAPEASR